MIRNYILSRIEKNGRSLGVPTVKFDAKNISVPGGDINVNGGLLQLLFDVHAFYLPIPPYTYGIVTFPDGETHNMEGGLHVVRRGRYQVRYVDGRERYITSEPIFQKTKDKEFLSLKVLIRYRIINPLIAIQIDKLVDTLRLSVESDISHYIQNYTYEEFLNPALAGKESNIFEFVILKHNERRMLSRAVTITGIELKEFSIENDLVTYKEQNLSQAKQKNILSEPFAPQIKPRVGDQDYKTISEVPEKSVGPLREDVKMLSYLGAVLLGIGINMITNDSSSDNILGIGLIVTAFFIERTSYRLKRTS